MTNPMIIIPAPIIIAMIPFTTGLPGALIHLAILGFKNAAMPISVTNAPATMSIIFVIPMVSISV